MILGLHHVAVTTPDLDRFIDHYQRWFGFEAVHRSGWDSSNQRIGKMVQLHESAARYAMLQLGGTYVEVFEYSAPEGRPFDRRMCDPGIIHFCLYVDDIVAEHARLIELGMEFHAPPAGAGTMLAAYGRDCDGNVVELLQVLTPDHPFPYARVPLATAD